jgi:hypothetical protein
MIYLYAQIRASRFRQFLTTIVFVIAIVQPVSAETQPLEWLPMPGSPSTLMSIAAVPNSRHGDLAQTLVREDYAKPQGGSHGDPVYDRMEAVMEADCRQRTTRPISIARYYHGRLVSGPTPSGWTRGWGVSPFPGSATAKAFEQACNGKFEADQQSH